MDTGASEVRVIAAPHPLKFDTIEALFPAGLTVAEIIGRDDLSALVWADGELIECEHWHEVIPQRHCLIKRVPADAGALRMVAFLALAVFAPQIAASFGLGALGTAAATAAIGIAGSLIINALIPPALPNVGGTGGVQSLSTITGQSNQAAPWGVIPKVYGTPTYYPPIPPTGLPYTELVNQDQYIRILLVLGYGPLRIGGVEVGGDNPMLTQATALTGNPIKLGGTSITQFENVEYQIGRPDQVTLFRSSIVEQSVNVPINKTGDDPRKRYLTIPDGNSIIQTTDFDTSEISIDVASPVLFTLSDGGNTKYAAVTFRVETSPAGAGVWTERGTFIVGQAERKPIRRTFRWTMPAPGRYDVRLTRVSSYYNHKFQWFNDFTWTVMRSIKRAIRPFDVADTVLMALRIKATDQIGGRVDRLSVTASGVIPVWDGSDWVPQATRNPAWIYADILTGNATRSAQPKSKLDIDALTQWAGFTQAEGLYYDGVIDAEGTVFDRAKEVAAMGLASWHVTDDAKFSVIREDYETEGLEAEPVFFDVTVGSYTATNGSGYGYDTINRSPGFGSITPDPPLTGESGKVGWIETFIGNIDGPRGLELWIIDAPLPERFETLRVQTASGTIDFDLKNPDQFEQYGPAENFYYWNYPSVIWDDEDIGQVRRITFVDPDPPTSILVSTPKMVVTPRNSSGFSASYAFNKLPDALRVQFIDPERWEPTERIVFDDGYDFSTAQRYEQLQTVGVTNPEHAWKFGRYHLAQLRLRPETYSWSQDIQHLAYQRGDTVELQHDVILVGLKAGRIKAITTSGSDVTGATVDELLDMESGKSYALKIQRSDGSIVTAPISTATGGVTSITFSPAIEGVAVGDHFAFGEAGFETLLAKVTRVEPTGDFKANITAVPAAQDILDAWTGEIPTFNPVINTNTTPPNVPVIVSITWGAAPLESATGLYIIVTFTVADASNTTIVEARIRPFPTLSNNAFTGAVADNAIGDFGAVAGEGENDFGWELAGSAPADAEEIIIDGVEIYGLEAGTHFELQLRSRRGDLVSDWTDAETFYQSGEAPPPPTNLAATGIAGGIRVTWDLPAEPVDFIRVYVAESNDFFEANIAFEGLEDTADFETDPGEKLYFWVVSVLWLVESELVGPVDATAA